MSKNELTESEKKYGVSVFKKWLQAKFDTKMTLEVVHKDKYYNPRLSIVAPNKGDTTKKLVLTAVLDIKGLENLKKDIEECLTFLNNQTT